jgi:hypothetical protein
MSEGKNLSLQRCSRLKGLPSRRKQRENDPEHVTEKLQRRLPKFNQFSQSGVFGRDKRRAFTANYSNWVSMSRKGVFRRWIRRAPRDPHPVKRWLTFLPIMPTSGLSFGKHSGVFDRWFWTRSQTTYFGSEFVSSHVDALRDGRRSMLAWNGFFVTIP